MKCLHSENEIISSEIQKTSHKILQNFNVMLSASQLQLNCKIVYIASNVEWYT